MEPKTPAAKAKSLESDIEALQANMKACAERIRNLPPSALRAQFEADQADMQGRLALREQELAALRRGEGGAPAL